MGIEFSVVLIVRELRSDDLYIEEFVSKWDLKLNERVSSKSNISLHCGLAGSTIVYK